MYHYLFGPVPSRRLGMSLGIDLIPKKICTLDCVYCEVGKTTDLSLERREFFKAEEIKLELVDYFESNPDPDYLTFSGSGEPTLHVHIGEIIQFIKQKKPLIPIAVLTNGTLLDDEYVRKSLMQADVVLPSLDAATDAVFQKINRPHKNIKIKNYIDGLVDFSREFKGKIWLEVFILPGYNDHKSELTALKKAILRINPDSVQLNTLDRPGILSDIRSASEEELQRVVDFWNIKNVEKIAPTAKRKNIQSYRKDTEAAIVETIARRPCTLDDLSELLGIHINEINKYLSVLSEDNKIETVSQERGLFYQIKQGS